MVGITHHSNNTQNQQHKHLRPRVWGHQALVPRQPPEEPALAQAPLQLHFAADI